VLPLPRRGATLLRPMSAQQLAQELCCAKWCQKIRSVKYARRVTMTSPDPLRRVRWVWALPLLATTATAILVVLALRQNAAFSIAHPHFSDTPWELQAPATLLAELLNGPGFFFPSPFGPLDADWIRLPGVALFWTWLGRGLDRKLHGRRSPTNDTGLRPILFPAVMFVLAVLFAWEFMRLLHMQMLLPSDAGFHNFFAKTHWEILVHLTVMGWYVGLAWSIVYAFYFGGKLLAALIAANRT
jgi:hypothetical protein